MLQALKNYYRRWQLSRRGIVRQLALNTFTAGDRSGVWTVCPDLLGRDSVVYSFGVGNNLSWDLAVAARFDLTVHAFDPTPASITWVAAQWLPVNLRFYATGLAGHDGSLGFALPRRAASFNYRPVNDADETHIAFPVARLATHMTRLGHDRLDVLKMDIEGAEYGVLDDVVNSKIVVPQLLVEFHHHFPGVGMERTVHAVQKLAAAGYRIFHISDRGLEISFVHDSALRSSRAAA